MLYELLTGTSPFARPSPAETFAQVLGSDPAHSVLPADTPPRIRRLLRRCLERDIRRRLQHIGDARIEIEDELAGAVEQADADNAANAAVAAPSKRRPVIAAAAVGLLAVGPSQPGNSVCALRRRRGRRRGRYA